MALRYSAARALGLFLLLSCSHITLVVTHEAQANEHHGTMNQAAMDDKPSYFSLSDHVGLLYIHIALMTVAWVVILPVAVMLSIVASRYTIWTQTAFIVTNIIGLITALSYNVRTPDLYPNNAHHKIGWIITNVVTVQVLLGAVARGRSSHAALSHEEQTDEQCFMPLRMTVDDNDYTDEAQDCRHSNERNCGNSIELLESQSRSSETTQVESGDEHAELLTARKTLSGCQSRHPLSAVILFAKDLPKTICSKGLWGYVALFYKSTDRIILPFGFIALTTGIVTMGRFFEGDGFFNGLAHWIKGGVFFWLGLFNLGRWAGSFADLGWAWNTRPRRSNRKGPPSAEFVESFLIFFYGSTNIFLEHLSNTDGKWTAQDLEHIAITVLFIGGGLCGMLVESTTVRKLLNASVHTHFSSDGNSALNPPRTYDFSLNPIPALVICLLGIVMGSHHQTSMTSTMVHKQWGNLLFGASFSRCLTYILMYLRPPSSLLPSRPPTELLTAFGLIAGGIVFMASSRDTVDGMVQNDLDAMFFYTVTMGMVGILMAWEVVVLALKGLALCKENRYTFNH